MDMNFRLLTIEDYEGVCDLWNRTPGMGMRSLDDSREGISKFLKRNPETNFVAEIDGKIVGAILCGHDGRRGYIYHTCVDEEYRGKQFARALVEKVTEALIAEGIHKVALVCFKHNELGNHFWQKIGWELREDLNYFNLSLNQKNR